MKTCQLYKTTLLLADWSIKMELVDVNVLMKIFRNNSKHVNNNFKGLSVEEMENLVKIVPRIDAIPKDTLLQCTIFELMDFIEE